jgi:hypothetical protein
METEAQAIILNPFPFARRANGSVSLANGLSGLNGLNELSHL